MKTTADDQFDTPLTRFEAETISFFLASDNPVLAGLRQQLEGCRVKRRHLTGVGFSSELSVPPSAARVGSHPFQLTDVTTKVAELQYGIGFVLFVRDGLLDVLEGFTFGEPWPAAIESFTLAYDKTPRELPTLPD